MSPALLGAQLARHLRAGDDMALTPPHVGNLRTAAGRPRLRISKACEACRARKAKCDGRRPTCARCKRKEIACSYDWGRDLTSRRTNGNPRTWRAPIPNPPPSASFRPLRSRSNETQSSSTTDTSPATAASTSSERSHHGKAENAGPDQKATYYTAHGRFAGEVVAAIDERAGPTAPATSTLVPFVDAPLFGDLDLDSPATLSDVRTALPDRAHADHLVAIYWQYVDPTEPVLDRDRFFHEYNASYSGDPDRRSRDDHEVWLGVLFIVFALAVQREESSPFSQRHQEGRRYFRRAWELLRPEAILWKAPSLEVVQCLMLINRYLHCTSNRHKTWMTAGLAARLAQSACCSYQEDSSLGDSNHDGEMKQRVWAACLALDRCVSWSLGKAPSLLAVPSRPDSSSPRSSYRDENIVNSFQEFETELLEIGNQMQLAQTQTRNRLAAKLGLPRLYQQDEYQAVAVQLDACLNKWEERLPVEWRLENLPALSDTRSRIRGYLLHCRLLHTRLFLYRPLLATFYKSETRRGVNNEKQTDGPPMALSGRLTRECAVMCIEAAQALASFIINTLDPNEPIGVLPWWYRILYLHIAGTTFLAAMFTPDLFTESVSQSWDSVMRALRGHEHLSAYVPRCIMTFETLSAKILETQYPRAGGGGNGAIESAPGFYEGIFNNVEFDFDNFLFGPENTGSAFWS